MAQLLNRAALRLVAERPPLPHYLQEKNAAEALAVTLAKDLPPNCPQARAEAWKKLPPRPANMATYLQQLSAVLGPLGSPQASNANQQGNPAQQRNQRKISNCPARAKLTQLAHSGKLA
jgi:hypothetical protein